MALWFFDTVPVGLMALVVICVAGGECKIRIVHLSYSTTETHTSLIWPCRIEEGRNRCLGGCGGRVMDWDYSPNRERTLQLIGSYRANQRSSAQNSHICYVGSREGQNRSLGKSWDYIG